MRTTNCSKTLNLFDHGYGNLPQKLFLFCALLLQIVNYGIGGHYEAHFDYATVSHPPLLFIVTFWYRLNV